MDASWEAYFLLLENLGRTLEQLTEIEREKTAAVRRDDLMGLDECMKREQAVSMSLRTVERKRAALLGALDVKQERLSALPERCPPQLRAKARKAAGELRAKYDVYRSAAGVARTTLECSLHQVEKMITARYGGDALREDIQPDGRSLFADIRT